MLKGFDKLFLGAAFASFLLSVALWFLLNKDYGMFVGLWVPSILGLWAGIRVCVAERRAG